MVHELREFARLGGAQVRVGGGRLCAWRRVWGCRRTGWSLSGPWSCAGLPCRLAGFWRGGWVSAGAWFIARGLVLVVVSKFSEDFERSLWAGFLVVFGGDGGDSGDDAEGCF